MPEPGVAACECPRDPVLAGLHDGTVSGAEVRVGRKAGDGRAKGDISQDETALANWTAMPDPELKLASMLRKGPTLHPRTGRAGILVYEFTRLLRHLDSHTVALKAWGGGAKALLLAPDDGWHRDHFTPGREECKRSLRITDGLD